MTLKHFVKPLYFIILFLFSSLCFSQTAISDEAFSGTQFESNKGDSILHYKGFSVIYSYARGLPLYAFNKITKEQLTTGSLPAKRSNRFQVVELPNKTFSASNADFYKSGYDRGHMVPAGDFVSSQHLKDETFKYTNINPQSPSLNRGIWASLENKIRAKVLQSGDAAYVVTGVLLNHKQQVYIGPKNREVPTAFFKIIYVPDRKTMSAFLFDNTINLYQGNLHEYQVTVDFLERVSQEDFFDRLDDELEERLESKIIYFDEY